MREDVIDRVLDIAKDNMRIGFPHPTDSAMTFWHSHLKNMWQETLTTEEIKEIRKKAKKIKVRRPE